MTTQDGYDWPSGCGDERWPAGTHQPAAPYFREQMQDAAPAATRAQSWLTWCETSRSEASSSSAQR